MEEVSIFATIGSTAYAVADIGSLPKPKHVHITCSLSGLGKVWLIAEGSVTLVAVDRSISSLMAAKLIANVTLTLWSVRNPLAY